MALSRHSKKQASTQQLAKATTSEIFDTQHPIPLSEMSTLRNVAIAGAAGNIGKVIFDKLSAASDIHVRVLSRADSKSTYPAGTEVVLVDFDSAESLADALKGQDAVISTLPAETLHVQQPLIDAAIKAGVKRFVPSSFGSDLANPNSRAVPPSHGKAQAEDYLVEKAKSTQLTHTFVYNGPFLDWGLEKNFIIDTKDFKPTIFGDGDTVFSTTTVDSVATGILGVLRHPSETKNRAVYLEDIKISQNELYAIARKVAPSADWKPQQVSWDQAIGAADERLKKGIIDMQTIAPYLFRTIMDPDFGGNFAKTDSELLGIKGRSKKDVEDIFTRVIST